MQSFFFVFFSCKQSVNLCGAAAVAVEAVAIFLLSFSSLARTETGAALVQTDKEIRKETQKRDRRMNREQTLRRVDLAHLRRWRTDVRVAC